MKGKTKSIVLSALAIGCSAALIAGATFAAFSSSDEYSFLIQGADVNVTSSLDLVSMSYAAEATPQDVTSVTDNGAGDADSAENVIVLSNGLGNASVTPPAQEGAAAQVSLLLGRGVSAEFTLTLENASNVSIKYVAYLVAESGAAYTVDGSAIENGTRILTSDAEGQPGWTQAATQSGTVTLDFSIALPWSAAEDAAAPTEMTLIVRAVQSNAEGTIGETVTIEATGDAAANGAALEAAIRQAVGPTVVSLGAGEYQLSGALEIPAGISLFGAQKGVSAAGWAKDPDAAKTVITAPEGASEILKISQGEGETISDVVIDGILVDGGNRSVKGILVQKTAGEPLSGIVIRNSAFTSCWNDGINVNNTNGAVIEGNYVEGIYDNAINLEGYDNAVGVTAYIRNNVIENVGENTGTENGAIRVTEGAGDVVVSGNTITNVTSHSQNEASIDMGESAIVIEKVFEGGVIVVEDNEISNAQQGIAVYKFSATAQTDRVIIRNNVLSDCGFFAIATSSLNYDKFAETAVVEITGNTYSGGGQPTKGIVYLETVNKYNEVTAGWKVIVDGAEYTDEMTIVGTAADLLAFAGSVNAGNTFSGETVALVNDIDLSGTAWTPIGTYDDATSTGHAFSGTFDGNNRTISNLSIDSTGGNIGFFGYVSGGILQDVVISGASVKTTGNRAGILLGRMVGGSVTNVQVSGKVEGNYYTGGIIGCIITNDVKVSKCINYADVTGGQQAGGIVGTAYNKYGTTEISECENHGSVSDKSGYGAGGIVGFLSGYSGSKDGLAPTVRNCINYGKITGANRAGGIAGALGIEGGMGKYNLTANFIGCSNQGTVNGTTVGDICVATVNYSGADTDNLTIVISDVE